MAGLPAGSTSQDFLNVQKADFTEMATSVAKHGGFYISRYEIGENGESKKEQKVVIATDEDGTNYIGEDNWYGLYRTCGYAGDNKQMIWGCQYDQVIKFIGNQAQIGHSDRNLTEVESLAGKNELDKRNNIYDLEGNYREWSMEWHRKWF